MAIGALAGAGLYAPKAVVAQFVFNEEDLSNPDPTVRRRTLTALSRSNHPRKYYFILRALRDPNPEVRSTAAQILAEAKNPAFIPALIDMLMDESPSVRTEAARALAAFPKETLELMVALIRKSLETPEAEKPENINPAHKAKALKLIIALPPFEGQIRELVALKRDYFSNAEVREAIDQNLIAQGKEIARTLLQETNAALGSVDDEAMRVSVGLDLLRTLDKMGVSDNVFVKQIEHRRPEIQIEALSILSRRKSPELRPKLYLIIADKDYDPPVRVYSLELLSESRDINDLPAFIGALADADPIVIGKAKDVIRSFGALALPQLTSATTNPNKKVAAAAGELLREISSPPRGGKK